MRVNFFMMKCITSDIGVRSFRSTASIPLSASFYTTIIRSQSDPFFQYLNRNPWKYWNHPTSCSPRYLFRPRVLRSIHSTTLLSLSANNNNYPGSTQKHQLYLQQIQELELERKSFLGMAKDDDVATLTTSTKITDVVSYMNDGAGNDVVTSPTNHDENLHDDNDFKSDREALYGFTTDERNAWSTIGSNNSTNHAAMLRDIQLARQQQEEQNTKGRNVVHKTVDTTDDVKRIELVQSASYTSSFSHLTEDQRNIHMVDVGSKVPTRRTATAQSMVIFPPEILQALNKTEQHPPNTSSRSSHEWIGPKGPIFSTAITAGIMGVKQTSSLIPLCHPLPIENIHIDIQWYSSNTIQITCTCSVTHKTGVEMEALMGCSIAALTVYDMVKAISHNVQITDTKLLYKDGGKRHVDERSI